MTVPCFVAGGSLNLWLNTLSFGGLTINARGNSRSMCSCSPAGSTVTHWPRSDPTKLDGHFHGLQITTATAIAGCATEWIKANENNRGAPSPVSVKKSIVLLCDPASARHSAPCFSRCQDHAIRNQVTFFFYTCRYERVELHVVKTSSLYSFSLYIYIYVSTLNTYLKKLK
jgi:hypothetical protein